jgi:hypothetical protein
VEQLVHQELSGPVPASRVDLQASPTLLPLAQVQIPLPDLHRFDSLLTEMGS